MSRPYRQSVDLNDEVRVMVSRMMILPTFDLLAEFGENVGDVFENVLLRRLPVALRVLCDLNGLDEREFTRRDAI